MISEFEINRSMSLYRPLNLGIKFHTKVSRASCRNSICCWVCFHRELSEFIFNLLNTRAISPPSVCTSTKDSICACGSLQSRCVTFDDKTRTFVWTFANVFFGLDQWTHFREREFQAERTQEISIQTEPTAAAFYWCLRMRLAVIAFHF